MSHLQLDSVFAACTVLVRDFRERSSSAEKYKRLKCLNYDEQRVVGGERRGLEQPGPRPEPDATQGGDRAGAG